MPSVTHGIWSLRWNVDLVTDNNAVPVVFEECCSCSNWNWDFLVSSSEMVDRRRVTYEKERYWAADGCTGVIAAARIESWSFTCIGVEC